jgi:hypothetical protein
LNTFPNDRSARKPCHITTPPVPFVLAGELSE